MERKMTYRMKKIKKTAIIMAIMICILPFAFSCYAAEGSIITLSSPTISLVLPDYLTVLTVNTPADSDKWSLSYLDAAEMKDLSIVLNAFPKDVSYAVTVFSSKAEEADYSTLSDDELMELMDFHVRIITGIGEEIKQQSIYRTNSAVFLSYYSYDAEHNTYCQIFETVVDGVSVRIQLSSGPEMSEKQHVLIESVVDSIVFHKETPTPVPTLSTPSPNPKSDQPISHTKTIRGLPGRSQDTQILYYLGFILVVFVFLSGSFWALFSLVVHLTSPEKDFGAKKRLKRKLPFWCFVLIFVIANIVFFAYEVYFLPNVVTPMRMKGLDPNECDPYAGGMVIAYNESTQEFTCSYVPFDLMARSKSEVGYILFFKTHTTSGLGISNKGQAKSIELTSISIKLVDHKTGRVIATETIQPPNSSTSTRFIFSAQDVEDWLRETLPTR